MGSILVTGGTRGIGRAIVEALLGEGWTVAFCSRNAAAVGEARQALDARWPGRVLGEPVDVRDQGQVASWIAAAADRFGRVDCLVNNAGLGTFGAIDEIPPEAFREVLETNLFGPYYAMAAVAPVMRRQGGGWIFNVGSLAAKNTFAGGAAYSASKFGLLGMSEAAMLDLRHAGIRDHLFSEMSAVRRASNRLSSKAISFAAGQPLADVQTGFRFYSRRLIERVGFPEARFEAESAVVVRAARAGFKVQTVPVHLGFADGRTTSHYRPLLDSLRIAKAVTRARFQARRWQARSS